MTDLNLFGWKMGGTTGKSGEAILKAMADNGAENGRPNLDGRPALLAALKAADSLVWSYDLDQRLFEFRGDLKNLGLPALWNRVFIDDLDPAFDAGECERLETV